MAATKALIEATDYCANQQDDAAKITAKAFRIPEADMKIFMARIKYRLEMPTDLVAGNLARLIRDGAGWQANGATRA
jgi:ABC-type nitrate/sulfonate/bicarbonate transport system substrate-binding protein